MRGPFSLSMAILLMAAPPVRAEEMKAGIEAGNVVLETGTQMLRLTSSGQDTEPVLTPDTPWNSGRVPVADQAFSTPAP